MQRNIKGKTAKREAWPRLVREGSTVRQTAACKPAADFLGRPIMTLCPVALTVGCIKCPVFKICPDKGIIGDYKKDAPPPVDLKKKQ